MKKMRIFAICLCALALGSCVKDGPINNPSVPVITEGTGNTTFAFTIPNGEGSTRSTTSGTVEDSGVHDQGLAEEYAVNDVDVYLFDSSSELLVESVRLSGIKQTSNTSSDLIVRYESDKFDIEAGSYNIFAIANSASMYDVTSQSQLLAYVDATYKNNALMTIIPRAGFIMTNRGASNTNVVIAENEDKVVEISLERVVAKIDVAQNKDSFVLEDDSNVAYATIKLQNYMMVNMATSYYLFRHEADLTSFVAPTFSFPMNYGNVSNTNGYVIDPYFFSKDASKVGSFTNADGFFHQPLKDVATNSWVMMPAYRTSSVSYCLENTLYHEAQLNGYTTGIIFEAKVTPSSVIIDANGNTTTALMSSIYYCNHKFYNSIATLEACLGGDIPGVDDSSTTEELEAAHITRLTLAQNSSDYRCYYNYWIKHYDNQDPDVMGVMEFGVVRNNHYKITIDSIGGMGTGEPDVDNERPDETDETLEVAINVIPWVVREQGSVELN